MLRVVVTLVVVGVMIYAFVDCLRADARDLRALPRPVWLLFILVPLVGALAYLVAGRPPAATEEPGVRPLAPDDDPEFLLRLEIERRRRQADEERRRRQRDRRADGGRTGDAGPEGPARPGPSPETGPEGEDQAGRPA